MSANIAPSRIATASGALFDYTNPVVTIDDVALGLGRAARFVGQTTRFLSVAEHSIVVSRIVAALGLPELALSALFHDGHEAYTADLPTPLKAIIGPRYREVCSGIDEAVARVVGVNPLTFHHPAVKTADELALYFEASQLQDADVWAFTRTMPHTLARAVWPDPLGMDEAQAREAFLVELHDLGGPA